MEMYEIYKIAYDKTACPWKKEDIKGWLCTISYCYQNLGGTDVWHSVEVWRKWRWHAYLAAHWQMKFHIKVQGTKV